MPALQKERAPEHIGNMGNLRFMLSTRPPVTGFDAYFASISSNYKPGHLSRYVADFLGAKIPNIETQESYPPHQLVELARYGPYLSLIVTTGSRIDPAQALLEHLEQSLDHIVAISRSGPSVITRFWVPFMGTGSGGLTLERSGKLSILAFLGVFSKMGPKNPRPGGIHVELSGPGDLSEDQFETLLTNLQLELLSLKAEQSVAQQGNFKLRDMVAKKDKNIDPAQSGSGHDQRSSETPGNFHPDRPVDGPDGDDLGRVAIAETIVQNVADVWEDHQDKERPFAVHLWGRWGSGKSSILSFLQDALSKENSHSEPYLGFFMLRPKAGWIVCNYNAWEMQGQGPAWWTLRNAVVKDTAAALSGGNGWFRIRDWIWEKRQVITPWLFYPGLILVLFVLGTVFGELLGPEDTKTAVSETTKTVTQTVDNGTPVVTETKTKIEEDQAPLINWRSPWSILVALASAIGTVRVLVPIFQGLNKSNAAKADAINALRSDATGDLKKRFKKIIKSIERPVAIFIDDLDRCDAEFVVELLQSIQLDYNDVPVLYVVAADRDWIVSAYNQVYDGFKEEISKPGQPLGYLFVKKIFQLSVSVPDLGANDREKLAQVLLGVSPKKDEEPTRSKEEIKEAIVSTGGDIDALGNLAEEVRKSDFAQELAPELLKSVSSAKGQEKVGHRLIEGPYLDICDPNPRAMKRLVNAITFRQGFSLMDGQRIPFDVVARWSILDQRFPYTAARLAEFPEKVSPDQRDMTPDNPQNDIEYFLDAKTINDILGDLQKTDIELVRRFG